MRPATIPTTRARSTALYPLASCGANASIRVAATALVGLALSVGFPALGAPEVGVTAAVNPNARGTPPGASPRTLVLGDTIIHRERIQTQGAGLVQVLLVDGSTFTVGPNSDLVIDEFVYDPAAGSGKLVASFSRGVARFVGGRLSKKPGGVSVKTPVGTIGIRGGIANINMSGDTPTFSLIFGDELTFDGPNGAHGRIFARGYTMEPGGGDVLVRRTRPQDLGRVQSQLVSRPGQSGGAHRKPGDGDVAKGVSRNNSGLGYSATTPPPKPNVVLASRANDVDTGGNETNEANKDTIKPRMPTPLGPALFRVLSAGTSYVVGGATTSGAGTADLRASATTVSDPGHDGLLGGGSDTDRTLTVNLFEGAIYSGLGTGTVATAAIELDGASYTIPVGLADIGMEPSTGSAFWFVTGRSVEVDPAPWAANSDTFAGTLPSQAFSSADGITHAGFLWSGPQQFTFAALFPEQTVGRSTAKPGSATGGTSGLSYLDGGNPIYFLSGKETDFSQYYTQDEEDAHIRTYALSGDPREMLNQARYGTDPYESNLFMVSKTTVDALGDDFLRKVHTSGLIVVEPDDIATNNPKFLDVSFLIDGTGVTQQAAASVIAGDIAQEDGEGAWRLTGTRRGSVRAAETAATASAGSFSSLANGAGAHIFGTDADNIVLGYDAASNGAFGDSSADPAASLNEAFGTIHVASLKTKALKSDYDAYRGTGTLLGYGAGVLESSVTTDATAFTGIDPLDLVVQFDATNNTVGAEIGILDAGLATQFVNTAGGGSPEFTGIGSFEFAFGQGVQYEIAEDTNTLNGGNAYIDNDTYAAVENPNTSRNRLNYWDTDNYLNDTSYTQSTDSASQNYFFSANAVSGADAALFHSADNPGAPQKCACAFMHWGYWGARLESGATGDDPIDFGSDDKRRDYFHLATWVAGDLPSAASIRDLGDTSATYTGHAVGNVVNTAGGITSKYLASGSLEVNWNFAARNGALSINDFDGGRFSATTAIADTVLDDTAINRFQGTNTAGGATFTAHGSFAAGPSDVAAGVLGAFSYTETSGDYQAAGTFMGQR
ncbi:FecR family protein [Breoghania corrubedonensis]|uniref:FecR family protein n=1 Tax=Breoghania corrubedonensis TaxID=665038 RepID=A0A2T5VE85_9HYPH|nr:FecR family protein [Breoghania corrubedonensis]PTW62069.1 FecR family protein [Breoghania corrubedonensis]